MWKELGPRRRRPRRFWGLSPRMPRTSHSALQNEHRARVQAELERARIQGMLYDAPVGLLSFVRGEQWAWVNRMLMELRGSPIAPRAGSPCMEELRLPNGHPVDPGALPCFRALAGERVKDEELAVLQRDGALVPVLVDAAPIFVRGQVEGIVVSLTDITECKHVEQLQRDLMALISHDLRAPLSVVSLGAALLEAKLEDNPPLRDTARRLTRASLGMHAMVDELLEAGRLESGTVRLELRPADLRELVQRACESVLTPEESARVRFAHDPSPVLARVDARRFERVVQNLLKNALEFSDTDVEIGACARARRADLWVRDHGPGMDADAAQRVFDRFWASPDSKRRQGTGLGLYICRLIAEAHGGECSVDTAPGRGSTFRFSIPSDVARPLQDGMP